MDQLLSAVGAVLILGAFWALQTQRLTVERPSYQLANLVGAGLLAAAALMTRGWAFVVLNTVWALVALWALVRSTRDTRPMPDSEDIQVGDLTIRFLVDGGDSDGSAALFEVEVPADGRVPVPHSHDAYEETMYGLEGTVTWTVDSEKREVGPGGHVCIKRGQVHGFVNDSGAPAKQLAVVTPAAIGPDFFRDMAALLGGPGPPDREALGEVMRRHGLTPAPPA